MRPGSLPADGAGLGDVPGAVDVEASGRPVAAVVAPGSRVGDDGEGAVAGWLGTAVAVGGVSVPPDETGGV
ncbi:hypothetical protein NJBCHELONAE_18590 [Mycobacteroides chelonae]|nr:hypothetical protein NJBCHELONAE_18590 [Mycobacteroides chelonae]